MATKQKKNVSYNVIQNINEDWTLDERNNKPYSGESVQAFIKKTFGEKAGVFYYDASTTKYLVFADAAARDLYLTDRQTNAAYLLGSFDAPANYEASIVLTSQSNNVILKGDTGNYINFTFDIVNKSGASTGESVVVQYNINNGGNIKKVTQVYNAGDNVSFLIDEYLSTGVNNVTVVLTGRNTLASVMVGVTFTVIDLTLTSDFEFTKPVTTGNYLSVPYHLEGSGVKYLQWYIDGVAEETVEDVSDLKVDRTKNISTTGLATGKHNVQVRAYVTIGGVNFYSKTLYFDFVVCPADETWNAAGNQLTYVLLGLVLASPATSGISISAKQYDVITYKLGMYDWRARNLNAVVSDNGTEVQTIVLEDDEIVSKEYIPLTSGSHTITFSAGGNTATIGITAAAQSLGISEETEDVLLKLSAKGRNNNESTPNAWTYGAIATTFNNISWNEQSGWVNDALLIPAGSSIGIDFSPLGNTPVAKGRTIEIDYEVQDVASDDAVVVDLIDSTSQAGIQLTATSAKLQSSGGTQINTKYRDGDRIHLAFIINKNTGDDACLMYIVNNGILERASSFAAADNFNVAKTLTIGSASCGVKIYSIRVYDKALSVDKALQNYILDQENFVQLARQNDILNSTTGRIDADKVNARVPIMIITGNMEPIFAATDKKTTVTVDVEYRNLQDPEKSFTIERCHVKPQGTSSLGYPRKNLRLYTNESVETILKDSKGEIVDDGLYSFKDGAQPVDCWCLKADYAESSGSHNTGVARLWNKLMYNAQVNNAYPLRTAAQAAAASANYKYDVRTTIDGFPIVLFYRPDENSELICLGQYNFNNDKSTESVFGFKDIPGFTNTNVQCFEVLANEDPIALFDDVSEFDTKWDKAFESRYPDTKTPTLTALKTLCTWVNACKSNQSKFEEEKANHFDIPKLAAYYVYLMRFGAVDQTVKNSMLTTEDGVHWFFINYDNDTVMGIDNISTVLNAWNYERSTTKTGGGYIFAGHSSVLWNCFEADDECMAMVRTIDNALYSAGLTYANLLKTFDEEQCDKWCERIYNDNGIYKYITPFKEKGSEVLYMLQGNRKSYRHWWLKNRMEMYDAKWATAAYTNRVVRFIAEGAPKNSTFGITARRASYFGYGINAVVQESGISVAKDGTHEFTIGQALAIGDPVNIYNAVNLSEVDLSDVVSYLTTLYLEYALDENSQSYIKKITLGDGTNTNNKFTGIGGLATANALEELDIRGFSAITSMTLTALKNLHVFKAVGSGLTSFAPAEGCTLTNVSLPSTLQSITLEDCNVTNLAIENYTTVNSSPLRNVSFKNLSGSFDVKAFITNWLADYTDAQLENFNVTLHGINWLNVNADTLIHWGHIGTKDFKGSVTLSSMSYSQYQSLVSLFGTSAFTDYGTFRIIAPAGTYFTGPSTLNYGQSGEYNCISFPDTSVEIEYLLYNGDTKVPTQYDGQGRRYATYNGVTLYEETGVVSVASNISADVTLKVRAHIVGTSTYTEYKTLTAKHAVYPTISISGVNEINQNGTVNYTKTATGTGVNTTIQSVAWSLSNNASGICSISNPSADPTCALVVSNTPSSSVTVTLTCLVTFTDGHTETATKNIAIYLTYPTAISLSGDASITDNGDYEYTMSETGSKTAALLSVVWSLTSNEYVTCSGNGNKATISVPGGNPTAATLTLTCTATYTGNVTRTTTKSISVGVFEAPAQGDWVDLGLPSGLLWCRHNVGATNPEDAGLYFAWGETEGYVDAADRNAKLGLSGGFNSAAHTATGGAAITDSVLTLEHDAAQVNMGFDWRMPTKDEFAELFNNTNVSDVTENGIQLYKFTSKQDSTKYILIPRAGKYADNDALESSGNNAMLFCRTSSKYDNNNTYIAASLRGSNSFQVVSKSWGFPVRAVRSAPVAVDLGLPSGTLWCDRNVGATAPEEAGLYFAWGETEGYKDAADRNARLTAENGTTYSGGFDLKSYKRNGGASEISSNLTKANDAAAKNYMGNWRMPTEEEIRELFDNTTKVYTNQNGVNGYLFTSTISGYTNKSIFLPMSCISGNTKDDTAGSYYSTKHGGSSTCSTLRLNTSNNFVLTSDVKYVGYLIRPVQ